MMYFESPMNSVSTAVIDGRRNNSIEASDEVSGSAAWLSGVPVSRHDADEVRSDESPDFAEQQSRNVSESYSPETYYTMVNAEEEERLARPVKGGAVGSGFYKTDTSSMSNPKRNRGRKSKLQIRY